MISYYEVDINWDVWKIPKIYQDLQLVGEGSYGQVCKALVDGTGMHVAIKRLNYISKPQYTYREIRLLKHMNHKNVIGLLDVFQPQQLDGNLDNCEYIYIVTQLMDNDLETIIYTQQLTEERIQYFVYQMLKGLKYIHSAGIVHRDVKPSNIGVNEDGQLRILDFGHARPNNDKMTRKRACLWYGAPECCLNWMDYDQSVDIWSVGCIMAELLTGEPLFPGEDDELQLLNTIIKILGTPPAEFVKKITEECARSYLETLPPVEDPTFRTIFKNVNPLAVDLLEKLLVWDPQLRLTCDQALAHPYLEKFHDPSEKETESASKYEQRFDDDEFSIDEWKQLIYEEVSTFKPPQYYNKSLGLYETTRCIGNVEPTVKIK